MTAAPKFEVVQAVMIPIRLIVASPTNPRKTFKDLEDLAESIKQRGVLQPVMVRPKADGFELVFGERRWRSSKLAGVEEMPAMIREFSDKEVAEIQLIENSKRNDVEPIEEADGYQLLIKEHGYKPEDIAAKIGKSRRTIYQRLQLCRLCPEGRKALSEERLHASVAMLIARIPKELQAKAVGDLAARDDQDSPLSFRAAEDHVQKNFMLLLKDAPWDRADATLVPKAGACTVCPKRTGNQLELYADVKSADVCTDPKCYSLKEDALYELKVADAKKSGQRVLTAAETKEIFPYQDSDTTAYSASLVALDDTKWNGDKEIEVKKLFGKELPPTVLARAPSGAIVQLVSAAAVEKKLKELQPERPRSSGGGEHEAAARKKLALRGAAVRLASPLIAAAAEKRSSVDVLRHVATEMVVGGGYHDAISVLAKRRELKKSEGGYANYDAAMRALVKNASEAELRGIVVELSAGGQPAGNSYPESYNNGYERAAKFAGVDLGFWEKSAATFKEEKKKPGKALIDVLTECAVPNCGQPGKKLKDSTGLWCDKHGKSLVATERESIVARNKRLAAPVAATPAPKKKFIQPAQVKKAKAAKKPAAKAAKKAKK